MRRALSSLSVRTRVALIVGAAALVWVSIAYLHALDPRFFPFSWAGLRGLASYLVGDYGGAGRAYRAQIAGFVTEQADAVDPAWAAFARGDLRTARERVNAQIARGGGKADWLTLGEIALADGQPAEALRALREVLDREIDHFDAGLLSSVAYARLGRHADAIAMLGRTMRYDRAEYRITAFCTVLETIGELSAAPHPRPLSLLAFYHRYVRIYDPAEGAVAIRVARAAIAAGDAPDAAYVTIGVVESKQGHWDAALKAFLEAGRINPKNPEAQRWAAFAYGQRGDLVNELRTARLAMEAAPSDPYYAAALHRVLVYKLGDYRQALEIYRAALEGQPRNAGLWRGLSDVYHQLGDEPRSLAAATRAAALAPADSSNAVLLGWALSRTGQHVASLGEFDRAVAINPRDWAAHYGRAAALQTLRRYPDAIAEYEHAFMLHRPMGADALTPLCQLYAEAAAFERARDCLKRALAMDPGYAPASRALRDVEGNLQLKASRR